jgi:hypothetical protein
MSARGGRRRLRLAGSRATRVVVPSVSVLVATGSAIVVNVLTTNWAWVWWPVLGVLVVLNVLLLVRFAPAANPGDVTASGAGSVAAGGSIHGNVKTTVHGSAGAAPAPGPGGVTASGPGAVAAGQDIVGDTTTDVG